MAASVWIQLLKGCWLRVEVAAGVRHDPQREGALESVRRAEGEHELPFLHPAAVPEPGVGEDLARGHVQLQDGQVRDLVEPHDHGVHLAAVAEDASDLARLLGDVVVGHHVAVRTEDHAAAEDLQAPGLALAEVLLHRLDEHQGRIDVALGRLDHGLEVAETRLLLRGRRPRREEEEGGQHQVTQDAHGPPSVGTRDRRGSIRRARGCRTAPSRPYAHPGESLRGRGDGVSRLPIRSAPWMGCGRPMRRTWRGLATRGRRSGLIAPSPGCRMCPCPRTRGPAH